MLLIDQLLKDVKVNMYSRYITYASWCVIYQLIHNNLQIPRIDNVISEFATRYKNRLHHYKNTLALVLLSNTLDLNSLKWEIIQSRLVIQVVYNFAG